MIRIIVVEDDPRLLENLAKLLQRREDFEVAACYSNAEDALAANLWQAGDVLISDIDLPGMSGIELIAKVKEVQPEVLPLAYTIYEDRDTVFAALTAGAFGYLVKGSSPETLETSIRELVRGGAPMSPSIARRLLDRFLQDSPPQESVALSTREVGLLKLVAQGLIYKEIGEQLGISPHTVHTHIKNIYGKLHATDRAHALRRARMLGYLESQDEG
ncbi:response regulator transcription factor [Luteolibacter sp. GHJ8]|uniref:Response regulator transcription factor n=1 Tax=Luteolibacter rhizosphaerae TaxID=2989719 RepID=A0ABT3G049_9BACT|nr:response regulator transcription factor [Luteolibacter rhizosphaerae]MCW1913219.1 response regulator transcription factor [Luteolibacter rhizosphaerae]